MKKLFAFMMLSVFISCEVEQNTPVMPVADDFDESNATLVKMGMMSGIGGHTASGTAAIYESNGRHVVVLDPFSSQNGPDLKVYLSKNVQASAYLNLGALQSTTGKQTYTIPAGAKIDEYGYVHIWCEKFSVEFARAQVE